MNNEIMDAIEDAAGMAVNMRIEDNIMLISPAEAGIMLLAAIAKANEHDSSGWQEADRLAHLLEGAREDNAMLRDLLESVHAVLVEFGATDLAALIIEKAYPIAGVTEDGTVVRMEDE